jgi:hypothetical protein
VPDVIRHAGSHSSTTREAVMPELETFTVGPPDPVTDSRQLPVVTPDDEGGFVTGADLERDHPDNYEDAPDGVLDELLVAATPDEQAAAEAAAGDADVPDSTDDELDQLTADVDTDDLDMSGFGLEELGFVGLDSLDDPHPEQVGGS